MGPDERLQSAFREAGAKLHDIRSGNNATKPVEVAPGVLQETEQLPVHMKFNQATGELDLTGPVAFKSCDGEDHDYQPDHTEKNFKAEKCSKCGSGRLLERKVL